MARFYDKEELNVAGRKNSRILLEEPQLHVLLHVLASQICRLDDPQYGCLLLYAMPSNDNAEWVAKTYMHGGDFFVENSVTGNELAEQSINAAVDFPDVDLHYTQMAAGGEQLWSNAYFDENLSVLVLAASHGQLLLATQLAYSKDGEEYAKESLLKVYAAAVIALRCMMPQDEVLQSACVTALDKIEEQYKSCAYQGSLMDDLDWIEGTFGRGRQPEIHQLKLWQAEHPEVKTYFRE